MPDATIDQLNIHVRANTKTAVNNIQKLIENINALKEACVGIKFDSFEGFKDLKDTANALKSMGTSTQKVVDACGVINDTLSTKRTIEAGTVEGDVETKLSEVNDTIKEGQKAVDGTNKSLQKTQEKLEKIKNTTKNLRESVDKTSKRSNKEGESTSKLSQFFSSITRILGYRIIRTIIKIIGDSIKDGIDSIYQYSLTTGTQFAKSMDSIVTSAKYLTNSIGSMIEPIANVLAPVIERIADFFVEINNSVAQFLAQITGATTWSRAIKYQQKYADSVKATVLGIDELNIMNGSANSDYSKMFTTETVKLSDELSSNASRIKNAFEEMKEPISKLLGKLKEFGGFLSETILPFITDIGTSLAEWTLGELTPTAFDLLGQAVETFQNILEPFSESLDTIKKDVFDPIGELLSNIFTTSTNTLKTDLQTIGKFFADNKNDIKTTIEIWSSALGTLLEVLSPLITDLNSLLGAITNVSTRVALELLNSTLQTLTGTLQMLDGALSMDTVKFFQGLATSLLPAINLFIWLANCIGQAWNDLTNLLNGTDYKYEEIPYQTVKGMQDAVYDAMYGVDSNKTNNTSSSTYSYEELADDLKAIRKNTAKGTTITSSSIIDSQARVSERNGNEVISYA